MIGKVRWLQSEIEKPLLLLVVYVAIIFGGGYVFRFLTKPLDPFALAKTFEIRVIEPSHIRALTRDELRLLTGQYVSNWSGGTLPLPDGWQLCILNHSQRGKDNGNLDGGDCPRFSGS